jgi:hypothetical protein
MSNQTFDFCNTSRVAVELPPEEPQVKSMNGWTFVAKPKVPYQRQFKVTLTGMKWILTASGNALDTTTTPTVNAGRLLDFYRFHRMWDSFLYQHEYLGIIRVRFAKPLQIPEGIQNAGGKIDAFEVELIEHNPSY